MSDTPVLIAGGGPVGLALALALDFHGVDAILLERNETTTRHPKMDITNGRSMELFRQLGVIDELRAQAVPTSNDYSVIWCTKLSEWELARFDYPSVDKARETLRSANDGTMALEPGMRVSQILLEPVLKRVLEERCERIDVRFGWGLESFTHTENGVTAQVKSAETGEVKTITADYLAGCDGAGSVVRRTLDIALTDLAPPNPETKDGVTAKGAPPVAKRRLYMIHFRSPEIERIERFGRAWHLQSPLGWSIIAQDDVDTWTIHLPIKPDEDPASFDPKTKLFEALGCEIECDILVANPWNPRLSLAESYGQGRVWMAGDAVHQVIPTGGYGMNTGIGDAVGLAWALSGVVQGWGGPKLLEAYDLERRHVGYRNRQGSQRHSLVRADVRTSYTPKVHEDTPEGAAARAHLGKHIQELGNLENEAWGLEWGYRYDESPIICHEDTGEAPPYEWEAYKPSTWPGVRVPNLFLEDGEPLFDRLGRGFTLLRFGGATSEALEQAAAEAGLPLDVVDINSAAAASLYDHKLVLVRPDQHCAWRGNADAPDAMSAKHIIDRIRGME
ncbi:MAG: FAD-dependent monooxygenase [Pseudomonadota bacterium]